jgi:hypothetical protein
MELFESSNKKSLWMVVNKETLRNFNCNLMLKWRVCYSLQQKFEKFHRQPQCSLRISCVTVTYCARFFMRAAASRMRASISPLPLVLFLLHPNPQTKFYRSKVWIFKLPLSRQPFRLRQMFIWTFFAQGPTLLPPKIFTFPPESPCVYMTRTKYLRSHIQI